MKELTIKMIEEAINNRAETGMSYGEDGMVKLAKAQGFLTDEEEAYYFECIRGMKKVEHKQEPVRFEKGAQYRLHCKNGDVAKRTATFVGMWNETEGLFRIGKTTRPVKIVESDGIEYTSRPNWFKHQQDMFSKYMNIDAKADRIA